MSRLVILGIKSLRRLRLLDAMSILLYCMLLTKLTAVTNHTMGGRLDCWDCSLSCSYTSLSSNRILGAKLDQHSSHATATVLTVLSPVSGVLTGSCTNPIASHLGTPLLHTACAHWPCPRGAREGCVADSDGVSIVAEDLSCTAHGPSHVVQADLALGRVPAGQHTRQ